jgi:Zn-dependent protease/CBS domain-containing protein
MDGTAPFVRVSGIPVRLHFSLLILVGLVVASWRNPWDDFFLVIGIFLCVFLHELGHALAARHYGIRTLDIVLYFIGGVARLDQQPAARQELWIALAGPAMNVLLALALSAVNLSLGGQPLVQGLIEANWMLAAFNLLPAFPLDGGRVLRSLLSLKWTDLQATNMTSWSGRGVALLLSIWAIWQQQWLFLLVALFIFTSARKEYYALKSSLLMRGAKVREAMMRNFATLTHGDSVRHAAETLLDSPQQEFPVLHGELVVGLLSREALMDSLAADGPDAFVASAMDRDFLCLDPADSLEENLNKLADNEYRALVMDHGKLLGMVTQEKLNEFLVLRNLGLRRSMA